MFWIYYPGNIDRVGRFFYLVSTSNTIYEVDGGVPDQPGFIAVPEQVHWAVVLTASGFHRLVEVYSVYYSFEPFHVGDSPWPHLPQFQEWVDYGNIPRAPLVYFSNDRNNS